MTLLTEDVIKLLLAILVGGLIGAEREYRDKAAGFRTIIFICVGASLFTNFSIKLGGADDATRIAANIVSGVGFLGAGAIMRGTNKVMGLTTASTIWLAAALGMGIGGEEYGLAIAAAVAVLAVLWVFPHIESWIDNIRDSRRYMVTCPVDGDKFRTVEEIFLSSGMGVRRGKRAKSGDDMTCSWDVHGKPQDHDQLVEKLLAHADVKEFQA
jgi:putative Mg2+ transporter-C (MgtC) family protein